MKILGPLGLLIVALVAVGCTKVDTYSCFQNAECFHDGVAGICEPGGLCSFPDPDCPSGKAFAALAGDQSSRCVDADEASTTAPTTTTPTTTEPATTTTESATTGPACAALGDPCADTPCCDDPCTRCEDGVCTALPAGTTPTGCRPECTMDDAALDDASCDGQGNCQRDTVSCGLYKCDADVDECRTKCMNDNHCISDDCMGNKCK